MQRERGSILIAVLWMVGLLTAFTLVAARLANAELNFGQWLRNRTLMHSLAEAGVERAMLALQSDKFLAFEALNEPWASGEKSFKAQPLAGGQFEVSCDHDGEVLYGACDESARININTAPEATLIALLKAVDPEIRETSAREIAQSIIDWRDADDAAGSSGAEKSFYKSLPEPFLPRNAPMESIQELQMVRGVTKELFEKLKPYITIYTKGMVNFNTAPLISLEAVGLSPDLAQKLIEFRRGPDKKSGTDDDILFQSTDSITSLMSSAMPFSPEDFAMISNAISAKLVTVKSDVFRIYSTGRLIKDSRNVEWTVAAVVKRDGTILYWEE